MAWGLVASVAGSLISKAFDKKEKAPQTAAAPAAQAAQQPSVFAQAPASQGTVKMEVPVQLASTVAKVIDSNA